MTNESEARVRGERTTGGLGGRRRAVGVAAVCAVVCAPVCAPGWSSAAAQPVESGESVEGPVGLRVKFGAHDDIRLGFSTRQVTQRQGDENEQVIEQDYGYRVQVVGAGGEQYETHTMQLTFEWIRFAIQQPGGVEMVFDSRDENAESPLRPVLEPLLTSVVTFQVSHRGAVSSVSVHGPTASDPSMAALVDQVVGPDQMQKRLARLLMPKPQGGPTRIGDEWVVQDISSNGSLGAVTMRYEQSLDGIEGEMARIGIRGELDQANPEDAQFIIRQSSIRGGYDWDHERGMLVSMRTMIQSVLSDRTGAMAITSTQTQEARRLPDPE